MDFKTFFKGALFSLIAVSLTAGFSYANQSNASKASVATQSELQAPVSEKNSGFNTLAPSQDYLMTGTAWTFFDDYKSWPASSSYKTDDNLRKMLYLTRAADCGTANRFNFFDINGDGLTDLIYQDVCRDQLFMVLLNSGNNNFEIVYKCVKDQDPDLDPITITYYGDCAAL